MSRARETSSDARLQAQQINAQAVLALNPPGNLSLSQLESHSGGAWGCWSPFCQEGAAEEQALFDLINLFLYSFYFPVQENNKTTCPLGEVEKKAAQLIGK